MQNNYLKLDEIDIKILNLLQKNGKLPIKAVADAISLSQTPVYERIRKMERNGAIQKYVALVNAEVFGKNLIVIMSMSLDKSDLENHPRIVEHLSSLPEVTELYQTSGVYDFILKVLVSNVNEFREFLTTHIANIQGIKDVISHIVLDNIKSSTAIELDSSLVT
ncbi:MAG: Lrp/AsnC family transcriptional regulator [Bacteroidia bacterium]|nr:Lrp/AsnC family transcriptional regulator [Bacteroidia bacterium]